MQLAATDIHGIDRRRAACQQALSEAAGRGADIEADAAARIEHGTELVEGGRELHPTARYVRMRRLGPQDRAGGNLLRRLRDDNLICCHTAGGNGDLRFGAALKQTALDEKPVDANTASHV